MASCNPLTEYPKNEAGVAQMMGEVYGIELNETWSVYNAELDAWNVLTMDGTRGLVYMANSDFHRFNDFELED